MKHTKLLLSMLLMAWLTIGAYAQINRIYIPDLKMLRGSETTLSVLMDNTQAVTAVEFTLEVPDGFTINPVSAILSERASNHQMIARKMKDGRYKFVIMSQTNALIDGIAGRIFTVQVKSSENVTDDNDYPLTISGAVMSATSGQNILQEADGGTITIKSMPNLHVVSVDCSDAIAGQPLTVKWKVRNDGRCATGDSSWKDYIWLVPNISAGTSMTGSKLLKTVDNLTALTSGESYENTVNVTLDERIYGNYDVVVASNMYGVNNIDFTQTGGEAPVPYDPEHASYGFLTGKCNASYVTVEEENEYNGVSDNFFYRRINIQVPPLPDIQVPHVVAVVDNSTDMTPSPINSAGLASSSAFYSGKKVRVTATIANAGGADAKATTISNVLYLSNTPDLTGDKVRMLSAHDMTFSAKAGESVTDEFTATIPYDWFGDTYFVVDADVDDAVYELANTANNSGATDLINTLLTPGADFEPYNLNAPRQIASGSPFMVSYAVRNVGPGVPYTNSWTDRIFISKKSTGLDNTATQIGRYSKKGSYKQVSDGYEYQGDNYKASRSVSVKGLEAGTYYIYVKVDANDDVFEYDGEDNNVIMSNAIQLSNPDLTVELVSVSEDTLISNDKVAVRWRIRNVGTSDIVNVGLKDAFYASISPDGSNAIKIDEATNVVSIVAGGEKVLRANMTIPQYSGLYGTRYIFIKTNDDDKIAESNTSNNCSAVITKVFEYISDQNFVNGMNFSVGSLQIKEQVNPGEEVPVSYTITNNGTETTDKSIKQELFISKNKTLDASARACTITGAFADVTGLKSRETITANVSIAIPTDMKGGANYVYVVINSDKSLLEKKTNDNQVKSPIYVNGNLPNLVVSDLVVPAEIMTSKKTEISWTLGNTGSWDVDGITCVVYLSKDATFNSDDRKLASVRSGKLAEGSTEQMKTTIELADDVVGEYHLIVKVDNVGVEEITADDNKVSQQFTSVQSPLPDLSISSLATEGTIRGSQPITIKGSVTNAGDDRTHSEKWTDVFYLSADYQLDIDKAIKLGSKTHVGSLEKDGSYDISATFTIPATVKGYYVLYAVTDGTTSMIEKTKGNNQAMTTIYVEDPNDTPADLVIRKMAVPSRIMAGEPMTITYNIANQGEYAAKGLLRDVLYMSKDKEWDENDTMVGVVTGDVNIEAGTEVSRRVTGRITNMPEGNYYLIVRANSTHAIAESNYDNNQTVARSASSVAFQTLSLDGSVTVNTSGLYKLPLHSGLNGKTVGLYLSTPENTSAGLYTAFERVPSTARYERSASDIEATEQEVLIPNVQEGDYYILAQDNAAISRNLNEFMMDGEQELGETTMTLSAREVQFGATSLAIQEGGNNGWISTDIHGALLDSIMDFRLTREGVMIPAESITFYDQTSTKASFNLNDAETGSYDIVSELPDGTIATLPAGFKVIPGTNVALGVKLDAVNHSRVDGYAPVNIAYANGGNTDIVIRELLLTIDGGYLSKTIEGFNEELTELHIRPDVRQDNRGFVTISPGMHETVNYYFKQTSNQTSLNLYIVK